jgi:uncharacterized membrane protein YqjE
MNDSQDDEPGGIFASVRALLDRAIAILHNRAELFTTELQEEVTRIVAVLMRGVLVVFAAIVAATFAAFAIVLFIPTEYRAWVAAGLALVFVLIVVMGVASIRKILRAKPRPFDASLRELEKDREHLRGGR